MKKYQQAVDKWISTHGVRYFSEQTNCLLLTEEIGEFARLVAREYGEQSFKNGQKPTNIKQQLADELADILFVVACLANQMDIDLDSAMAANLDKKTRRDQDRHRTNPKL